METLKDASLLHHTVCCSLFFFSSQNSTMKTNSIFSGKWCNASEQCSIVFTAAEKKMETKERVEKWIVRISMYDATSDVVLHCKLNGNFIMKMRSHGWREYTLKCTDVYIWNKIFFRTSSPCDESAACVCACLHVFMQILSWQTSDRKGNATWNRIWLNGIKRIISICCMFWMPKNVNYFVIGWIYFGAWISEFH